VIGVDHPTQEGALGETYEQGERQRLAVDITAKGRAFGQSQKAWPT